MADLKITALFVMSVATLLVFQGPQNTQALSYLDAYRNEVVAPDYNPYVSKHILLDGYNEIAEYVMVRYGKPIIGLVSRQSTHFFLVKSRCEGLFMHFR